MPSAPWRVEFLKIFKKNVFKIPKMPKIVPKKLQTCFERVLGQIFRNILCPVFHGGSRLRKFSKKFKKRQTSKKVQNRSQKCPKKFWTCFGANSCKKIFCPVFHGGSRLRKISKKIKKNSKFQKYPKSFPKKIQKCFELVLGQFFSKNFCPVFHGGSNFRKFSKKNIFKIPKMPKSFPKSIQTCFEHVLGKIFWKIFAQFSMECRVFKNFRKKNIFKIPKLPKSVPKSIQKCFGVIFLKKFYAQCSMEGRVFENFQNFFFSKFQKNWKSFPKVEIFEKNQKFSKFQKSRKSLPKVSKRVLNLFWGNFFQKNFYPSVPWRFDSSKIFKKNQKIFKIPKIAKIVPKRIQTCFERACFAANFSNKNFCPVFHGGSRLRKFSKKSINFQKSKNNQNRSQTYPNVFWTCFGATFWKKIRRSVPWRLETSKSWKNRKNLNNPNLP